MSMRGTTGCYTHGEEIIKKPNRTLGFFVLLIFYIKGIQLFLF